MFYIKLDDNNYWTGIYSAKNFPQKDWETVENLPEDDEIYGTCYKLVDGKWILDKDKKENLKTELENYKPPETAEKQLEELKSQMEAANNTIDDILLNVIPSMIKDKEN